MKKIHLVMLFLLISIVGYANAISLFDLRADVLMSRLPELKKNLNLNANQQILWQQSEKKTNSLLRAKEIRQIKVDQAVRDMIQQPNAELRDIDVRLSEEKRAATLDEQQGREIWLTMFDALNDTQRQLVQNFLYEQLQESGNPDKPSTDKPDSTQRKGRGMSHNPGATNAGTSF
jgi:hypothetical protein